MTAPDTATRVVTERESGKRWYFIHTPAAELRLMSVTSAFRIIHKIGLAKWMTWYTATAAFGNLPAMAAASRRKPCGRTTHRCADRHDWKTCEERPCDTCRECVAAWLAGLHEEHAERRADEGRRVHDVIEWWAKYGEIKPHDDDIAPYVETFRTFTVEHGLIPESFLMCEATCYNPGDAYAGTTDGVLVFEAAAAPKAARLVARVLRHAGEYAHLKTSAAILRAVVRDKRSISVVVDWKTREAEGPRFYGENALQLAGYRRCPLVRIKDTDVDVPMPATDGGVVVQLRPDGYNRRPVDTGDGTYAAFLWALRLSMWFSEEAGRAVGVNTFPLGRKDTPDPDGAETPTTPAVGLLPDPFALVAAADGADLMIPF